MNIVLVLMHLLKATSFYNGFCFVCLKPPAERLHRKSKSLSVNVDFQSEEEAAGAALLFHHVSARYYFVSFSYISF